MPVDKGVRPLYSLYSLLMQRIKEDFLDSVETILPLNGLSILEIGCGDGSRSVGIAARCQSLTSVEPDERRLKRALALKIPHAVFKRESGEHLSFDDHSFDVTIFTLSFHHIPREEMERAIDEAVRVTRTSGYIIIFEPTDDGTFFDAEIQFDACDGDERKEKHAAYQVMMNHKKLRAVKEMDSETIVTFDSKKDFVESMAPKKNIKDIESFLERHKYTLRARRRINIFQPK